MSEVFDSYLITDRLEIGTIVTTVDTYQDPVFNSNTLMIIVDCGYGYNTFTVRNIDSTLPNMKDITTCSLSCNIHLNDLIPYSFEMWKEKTGRDINIAELCKIVNETYFIDYILIHEDVAPKVNAEIPEKIPTIKDISSEYELSEEEKTDLSTEITSVLKQYGYYPEQYAIDKIINEWLVNKGYLINMFKEHPYYNGKYQIAFSNDFERKVDTHAANEFANWIICWHVKRNVASEHIDILYKIYSFLRGDALDSVAPESFVNEINNELPVAKLAVGMKTSRAINKICTIIGVDKLCDYNRNFAKCSDALNPLKIKRHTVLSVHPVDYLLMSNGNSWNSCHMIGTSYDGCYSGGTISYMLDRTSMVFYTVDARAPEDKLELEKKITRNMFFYDNKRLVQSRLYPQNCDCGCKDIYDDYRHIVQRIITTCLGTHNFWKVKRGTKACKNAIISEGVEYMDWCHFSTVNISTLKDFAHEEFGHIYVGKKPICPECGCHHWNEESVLCSDCYDEDHDYRTCPYCGCEFYYEDGYHIDGTYYCNSCVEYCEYHQRYEVIDSDYDYRDRLDRYYCLDAINESDYLFICQQCGKLIDVRDKYYNVICIDDMYFCDENCVHNHGYYEVTMSDGTSTWVNGNEIDVYYCVDCQKYFLADNFNFEKDVCNSCLFNMKNKEELAEAS